MSDVLLSHAELLVEEVESAALQLPREARARIAGRLLSSLDDASESEAAWEREIHSRVAAFRAGEIKAIPLEDTLEEIEDLLR